MWQVISHPHQLPPIVLSVVSALNEKEISLKVYSTYPPKTDWDEVVFASQGKNRQTRGEDIQNEIERIPLYQMKSSPDLARFEGLEAYHARRDGGLDALKIARDSKLGDNDDFRQTFELLSRAVDNLTPEEILAFTPKKD